MSFCVIIIKPHIQQQQKEEKKNPYFSRITIWRKMPLSQEINNFIKVIHTRLYQELLHLFFALKYPRSNPHPDKAFFV